MPVQSRRRSRAPRPRSRGGGSWDCATRRAVRAGGRRGQCQLAGPRPIAPMGGGTALIGDPSGKPGERPLLSKEQAREHVHLQRDQMARLLDFDPGPAQALVLNNADWLVEQRLVDFLRDIGKHFTVNIMLQKESVQARLDGGISYTEFSYMLLQAYDFLH